MPGRGGRSGWLPALGLVLVATGLAATQTSGAGNQGVDPGSAAGAGRAQHVPAGRERAGDETTPAPFVVEPPVWFEEAPPSRPPRTPGPVADPAALSGVPLRVVVPALGVDAPVVPVAAIDGVLHPPADPRTLGWWSQGSRPGEARGSALITGHTVHTGGGALDDIDRLRAGDRVRVRTRRGVLTYAVTDVTVYRKASLARRAQRLFSQTVPGRLLLVTCEDWNGSVYLSNVVVVAEPTGAG